jgi:hypothetical protein
MDYEYKEVKAHTFNDWVIAYDAAVQEGYVRQDDTANCPKHYGHLYVALLKKEIPSTTTRKVVK